ncbi:hypothetical protein PtB15_12B306 [Puccinia triticina]|nr:hypothetical protein PtB15_12B306 [Puccinia triticina]
MFFGEKPQLDWTRVFGAKAYVLVAPEKRKKLDDRAVEGLVVGHLPGSKGWKFWLPASKKLISSAWANFGRNTLPAAKVEDPIDAQPPTPDVRQTESKRLQLNDFTEELEVASQETMVDATEENCSDDSDSVPATFRAAMRSKEAENWKKAINTELENLRRKKVWEVRKLPARRRKLEAQWVFAKKLNDNGSIKYKARYVAKGFNQKEGTDFAHTFAPTPTFTLMRVLLITAAKNNWPIYNFDFVAAYLNAPIDEEVWVQAPKGLNVNAGETLDTHLCSYYDSSVYTLSNRADKSIIWVHVDDGIVTGSSEAALQRLELQLKGSLEIKWKEGLMSMVGVKIKRKLEGFELTQPNLIEKILKEHWDSTVLNSNPLLEGFAANSYDNKDGINSTVYLSTIGSLSYVAVGTRPEIAYSVKYLARFSAKPLTLHWKGLRHLLGYLANTKDMPLLIHPSGNDSTPVECFVDANWGGPNSRLSYGVLLRLYGAPIMWVSRRLVTVASSTCQTKYMALGHATRHALWIRNLLSDILGAQFKVKIFCNNQLAVKIGCEDASNKRTHHIGRDFYVTNQALFEKKTSLEWIPGKDQIADVLTKALGKTAHGRCGRIVQGFSN